MFEVKNLILEMENSFGRLNSTLDTAGKKGKT